MLIAALTDNGVGVVADESTATPKYAELIAIRATEIVAEGDGCDGAYAETRSKNVVLVEAARCRTLPPRAAIAAISGHSLPKDAARAWDAMAERCSSAETVDVTLSAEDHPHAVKCPQRLPRRARYLRITRAPFD